MIFLKFFGAWTAERNENVLNINKRMPVRANKDNADNKKWTKESYQIGLYATAKNYTDFTNRYANYLITIEKNFFAFITCF